MWQCRYEKEPFDMRLFVLQCLWHTWEILGGALLGLLLVGGIYYLKNVSFAGTIPYEMDSKYYLEYAVDPSDQQTYSYFGSYTWNDLLKSDEMIQKIREGVTASLSLQELRDSFEAELVSDLRICYIHITHVDPATAYEIDRAVGEAMVAIGERQKELVEVSLLDRGVLQRVLPDVRTLRACVLGAVLGAFFVIFGLGIHNILGEQVQVPGTLARRYGIPAAGYIGVAGETSEELSAQLDYLLRGKKKIGLTAAAGESNLVYPQVVLKLLEEEKVSQGRETEPQREYIAIPSLNQVPEAGEVLRSQDGILLLVYADYDRGKAIEETLRLLGQLDVPVDAMVLVDANERLNRWYRGLR